MRRGGRMRRIRKPFYWYCKRTLLYDLVRFMKKERIHRMYRRVELKFRYLASDYDRMADIGWGFENLSMNGEIGLRPQDFLVNGGRTAVIRNIFEGGFVNTGRERTTRLTDVMCRHTWRNGVGWRIGGYGRFARRGMEWKKTRSSLVWVREREASEASDAQIGLFWWRLKAKLNFRIAVSVKELIFTICCYDYFSADYYYHQIMI
ncbi:hypothetical protein Nepgr_005035 [Nepenthes gracilis]|uniref:Uncharacterized protein n=1 Tax=Nepenthes gracilis TaxID=150966 RepID=A0AAD3XG48_NEPGR|nr:hypothetical protein Nepgr_005035 [Nepenthes gracilis]